VSPLLIFTFHTVSSVLTGRTIVTFTIVRGLFASYNILSKGLIEDLASMVVITHLIIGSMAMRHLSDDIDTD